ncbi:hypothetical protein O181_037731 [Austropuccinia psidii MF-1]|uniref:Uncharacterized protein n=1 Tax=Austropuccinia psidii MF-1 TaxID=1389203 RepID=A0A9Q3D6S1_9BASI|nr:hypothetical protein [Austropuccinia psidii MF-1]
MATALPIVNLFSISIQPEYCSVSVGLLIPDSQPVYPAHELELTKQTLFYFDWLFLLLYSAIAILQFIINSASHHSSSLETFHRRSSSTFIRSNLLKLLKLSYVVQN